MVKPRGIVPTPEAWAQIKDAVRHIQRNQPVRKARRMPRRRATGGRRERCITVIEIKFEGSVTSGTVSFDVPIWTDDTPTVDTDTLTLNYDDTAAEVQTTWETHSGIAASGADIDVKGGPLPDNSVYIVFLSSGALNRNHPLPTVNTNSLTGTNVKIKTSYMTNADWEA